MVHVNTHTPDIHTPTHAYTHICTHMHMCAYTYKHMCMNTHTHICMYSAIQAHTHPYTYVHKYTHTHSACMQSYMYTHIHTHMCMHTHMVGFFLLKTEVLLGGLKGLVQASLAHSPHQRQHLLQFADDVGHMKNLPTSSFTFLHQSGTEKMVAGT